MIKFVILLSISSVLDQVLAAAFCQRQVCFVIAGEMYNRLLPEAVMKLEDINPLLCTHIVYGFAHLKNNNIVAGHAQDESNGSFVGNYQKIIDLKKKNLNLKVLLSLGGWSQNVEETRGFYDSDTLIRDFVNKTVHYLRERHFDGLDVMWILAQYNTFIAKKGLLRMLRKMMHAFTKTTDPSSRMLLTATVYGYLLDDDTVYEYQKVIKSLDWINMLLQDLTKYETKGIAHHSPLYTAANDTGPNANLSLTRLANRWHQKGIPKDKLVLGVPLFGRAMDKNTDAGTIMTYASEVSKYVNQENGYRTYFEICELAQGGEVNFMEDQGVPYLEVGNLSIGFDNVESVKEKVRFIKNNSFGGVVMYSVADDDFSGNFCHNGTFPLMNAINNECNGSRRHFP